MYNRLKINICIVLSHDAVYTNNIQINVCRL